MCRLSIVVPYDRDEAAFETTLVSVLENRPEFCEVIVTHDGQYRDPFDLADEVRFVVGPDSDSASLIRSAISVAHGRVVHVMMGGIRATENWTDEPLSMFEQVDLGCVAPVIRDLSAGGKIVSAGWRDVGGRLQQPIASGLTNPSRREVAAVQGAYLAASFWRRATIEGLLTLPLKAAKGGVDYVLAAGLQRSGWRCRLAPSSAVLGSTKTLAPVNGKAGNWGSIQAFRSALGKERGIGAVLSGMIGAISSPFQIASWLEMVGRSSSAFGADQYANELAKELRLICPAIGPNAASEQILKLPNAGHHSRHERRAA